MTKFYVNVDYPAKITTLNEVGDAGEVTEHGQLWKFEQIELPDDLVERWTEADEALWEVEREILALEKQQMPKIQAKKRQWMDHTKAMRLGLMAE